MCLDLTCRELNLDEKTSKYLIFGSYEVAGGDEFAVCCYQRERAVRIGLEDLYKVMLPGGSNTR